MSVSIAIPISSELAAAIVRCDWTEPHLMAAYVVDWQRRKREAAEARATLPPSEDSTRG